MEAGLKQNKIDALSATSALFKIRIESLLQREAKEKSEKQNRIIIF